LLIAGSASAQADSAKKAKQPPEQYGHQLRFSFDILKPVLNLTQNITRSYEAQVDYYIKKEIYAVVEGGAGSAIYDYPDLSYRSTNSFFKIGLDKTLIKRIGNRDWDAAFMGARYGVAFINRQEATYTIMDSLWGFSSGTIPSKTFTAHWAEVTGGVRVEILKNLFAGWNVRGKFLLNDKAFRELSPVFIAGFGKGDKTTVFDFNFYISYAIRWGAKNIETKEATP
jgi:hypothetical protein